MAPAATVKRPWSSANIAILKPSPGRPTIFSSGTSTPSMTKYPVLPARMPHFSFSGPLENPLNVRSTMNALMPDGSRCCFFCGSVQAITRKLSATSASEIHVFSPVMTYRSPFLTAVVWMARASLPAPGSVSP